MTSLNQSSRAIPLHLVGDLAERVKAGAIQEAARRFREKELHRTQHESGLPQDEGNANALNARAGSGVGSSRAGERSLADITTQSSMTTLMTQALGESDHRHVAMAQALQREKARNDVDSESMQREMSSMTRYFSHGLPEHALNESQARLRVKEVRLAQIESQFEELSDSLHSLGVRSSIIERDVRARGSLAVTIGELDEALMEAEEQLATARRSLQEEKQLLSDLDMVDAGMQLRQQQLERSSTQLTEKDLANQLQNKLRAEEEKLGTLLNALIQTSTDLFDDRDSRSSGELRSLLDALMNRAWDVPADPYILSDRYSKSLVSFLIRAHVAQEHPRESRRVRLLPFQKGVR